MRHPDSLRLRQAVVPGHVLFFIASLLATPLTLLGWAWPVLYVGILAAVSVLIAAKRRSFCGLLCGPAAAVMHFSWAVGFIGQFLRAALGGRR